ncbi:MAG: DUF2934 domain-containing protein [Deltaproteobacteria bacterium]|nr:DUF2934 domain-containing protein [Deltaproteobacteria bacterium]
MEREDEIRTIAYHIWEDEGRPEGRVLDHWLKAETIWQGRERGAGVLAAQSAPSAPSEKGLKRAARSKTRPLATKAKSRPETRR